MTHAPARQGLSTRGPEASVDAGITPAVAERFAALPQAERRALIRIRELILEAAASDPRIGPLEESLKWGQPAWRPRRPRTGTTLRIDAAKGRPGEVSLFFHCRTGMVEAFRERHAGRFAFQGERELSCPADAIPEAAVKDCARVAFTWHITG